MTPREKLELRHIADTLFREARETIDGKFVIDSRTLFHLVRLLDAATKDSKCGRCQKVRKQYKKAEALLDVEKDTLNQQIEDLKEQLKEYKKLPLLELIF